MRPDSRERNGPLAPICVQSYVLRERGRTCPTGIGEAVNEGTSRILIPEASVSIAL